MTVHSRSSLFQVIQKNNFSEKIHSVCWEAGLPPLPWVKWENSFWSSSILLIPVLLSCLCTTILVSWETTQYDLLLSGHPQTVLLTLRFKISIFVCISSVNNENGIVCQFSCAQEVNFGFVSFLCVLELMGKETKGWKRPLETFVPRGCFVPGAWMQRASGQEISFVSLPTINCSDICDWRPSPAGLCLLIHPHFTEGSRKRRRRELSNGVDGDQRDIRLPSAFEWLGFLTTGGSALPTCRENWLCSLFVSPLQGKISLGDLPSQSILAQPCKVVHFIVYWASPVLYLVIISAPIVLFPSDMHNKPKLTVVSSPLLR